MYVEILQLDFSINIFFCFISIHSIVICIESCLFGIFVVTVLVDQIHSIVNDRSLIDTLKLDDNSRMAQQMLPPKLILFRKVFGSGKNNHEGII